MDGNSNDSARLENVRGGFRGEVRDLRQAQESKGLFGRLFGGPVSIGGAGDDVNLDCDPGMARIKGTWVGKGAKLKALKAGVAFISGAGRRPQDVQPIPPGRTERLQDGALIRFTCGKSSKDYRYREGAVPNLKAGPAAARTRNPYRTAPGK
jgi:hypothetical protein